MLRAPLGRRIIPAFRPAQGAFFLHLLLGAASSSALLALSSPACTFCDHKEALAGELFIILSSYCVYLLLATRVC